MLDYAPRFPDALAELCALVAEGKLEAVETEWHGIQKAPAAFVEMMQGANVGKAIVNCEATPFDLTLYRGAREALPPRLKGWLARTFAAKERWTFTTEAS